MARAVISDPKRRAAFEPIYDADPHTGVSVEVFFADHWLAKSFGARSGWFWWRCKPGCLPDMPPTGPFGTGYTAYRDALDGGRRLFVKGIVRTVRQAGRAKHMAKAHLKLVTPAIVKRTVTPKRLPNAELRTREHLTEAEAERLTSAARKNRWGHRDATMILVAYRHGLRASELVDLRWDQVDFRMATLHVRRVKQGTPSTHPILGDELRALRRLRREQEPRSPFVFLSERGAPFTTAGFARMIARAGAVALLAFKAHPHMLRHTCGFALANKGHDTRALQAYLGHRNIQHTVRYTELSPTRFKDFWRS